MNSKSLHIIRSEHSALAAMLRSMRMMLRRGPDEDQARFFEVLRAMLFYVDEFPERLHHPKESELLFPRVRQVSKEGAQAVDELERQHESSLKMVRELQHLLLAWELLGETRRDAFTVSCERFIDFYLHHMQLEEEQVLPLALKHLAEADWQVLDAAFEANKDPLSSQGGIEPIYEALFRRIVNHAPQPIGLGER